MIFIHALAILFIGVSIITVLAYGSWAFVTGIQLWLGGHAEIKRAQARVTAWNEKVRQTRSKELSAELGRVHAMFGRGEG